MAEEDIVPEIYNIPFFITQCGKNNLETEVNKNGIHTQRI